jgi:hypothetical protein
MALKIINCKEQIIGPLAWLLAGKVTGLIILNIDEPHFESTYVSKSVIDSFVGKYKYLFGKLGIIECREAVTNIINTMKLLDISESLS